MAVITIDAPADAVPLARALVRGGVSTVELAWRTPATMAALDAMKREVPEMLVGIGTILTPQQVEIAHRSGADFGVAPGFSRAVVTKAIRVGLPFAPGIQTATDIQSALELGCRWLKFFPAEPAGGVAHLRSLHAPFAHLGLKFIALGGIDEGNAGAYLRESCMAAIGGSWIASRELIEKRAWDVIAQRAAVARALAVPPAKANAA